MALPNPGEKAIFNAARRIEAAEARRLYLEQACGEDRDMQARIEALLRAHDQDDTFQQSEVVGFRAGLAGPVREAPGAVIGPYTLLEQIGEGGMGTVFLAEQEQPVRRRVALKVIKAGMDSAQVLARFEAERQALALMDHPNIARVLDVGTTGEPGASATGGRLSPVADAPGSPGRPYFVMELVQGVPITRFCDEQRLTPRQRLELFVLVCHAVQHAHQKGIIHRDIKPSNVLVAFSDGKAVPKVIDFGLAKATGQKLTAQTHLTQAGSLIGTLEYMSPEQTEPNQLDIDTRSDIYALGVLLYELLTGSTPLRPEQLKGAGLLELLRMIREEEPTQPSTRLGTAEELASVATNRGLAPEKLPRLVRGDLDWIVMKCLEKDRTRRYDTASSLARDIERYLNDEPVEASPPGAGYRLRKFVKRHRGQVLAAGLLLATLLAGMAGTTWGMFRAEQSRQDAVSAQLAEAERAEEAQKRLEQIEKGAEVLASVFRDLDPKTEQKEGVTLRVLLGRRLAEAARQLEGEAVGDPLVVARLQHLMGISLRELGHPRQAELVLAKAGQTRERLLGADHLDTIATKHNLASLYRVRGNYAQAETLSMEVVAVRTARLGPEHSETLSSMNNLALLYMSQGKHAPAEKLLEEVSRVRTARLGADDLRALQSKHNLAGLYQEQGKHAAAEKLFEEVLRARTARLGPGHPDTLLTKNNLSGVYSDQGKDALAERLLREVLEVSAIELGPRHPFTLQSKNNLAMHSLNQGKHALAETLFKEVLEAETTLLGPGHPSTLQSKTNLARLYRSMKKFDRAIPLLEEVLRLSKATLDADHADTLLRQANLALTYCDVRRFADAIVLLEEVYRKGSKYPQLARFGTELLVAYVETGKKQEATTLATEQVQAARKQFPAGSGPLAAALGTAGKFLLDVKAYTEAEQLLRESLSLREKLAPTAWNTYNVRSLLGGALLGQEKYAEAGPHLVQGYAGMKEREAKIPNDARDYLTQALQRLVQLDDARGNKAEAARWRKELEARKPGQKR